MQSAYSDQSKAFESYSIAGTVYESSVRNHLPGC